MNANITFNDEKNGIEIRFDEKPEQKVIDSIKEKGFRWSNKQKMWFAKRNNERVQFVNSLGEVECNSVGSKNKIEKQCYNLWNLTRTEDIPNKYELYRIIFTNEYVIDQVLSNEVLEKKSRSFW